MCWRFSCQEKLNEKTKEYVFDVIKWKMYAVAMSNKG